MQFLIRAGDEVPIYRQIVRQVTDAVASGHLALGEKLPSHRELGERLVIAPLTVKKAYDELERSGVIESRRGRGTYVASERPQVDRSEVRSRLRDSARRLLAEAWVAGVSFDEMQQLLVEAQQALSADREQGDDKKHQKDQKDRG